MQSVGRYRTGWGGLSVCLSRGVKHRNVTNTNVILSGVHALGFQYYISVVFVLRDYVAE